MPETIPLTLLTPTQTAEVLELGLSTLARWRLEGTGPCYIKLGRSVRYRQSDIDAWLEKQTHQSTSEEVV